MKQPDTHLKLHSSTADHWDPYRERDSITPRLDECTFNMLNSQEPRTSPALFMTGCLDAPDEIPCGSTMVTQTVGGWAREHYHRLPRGCEDYANHLRATREVGEMLQKIMAGWDDEDDEPAPAQEHPRQRT